MKINLANIKTWEDIPDSMIPKSEKVLKNIINKETYIALSGNDMIVEGEKFESIKNMINNCEQFHIYVDVFDGYVDTIELTATESRNKYRTETREEFEERIVLLKKHLFEQVERQRTINKEREDLKNDPDYKTYQKLKRKFRNV